MGVKEHYMQEVISTCGGRPVAVTKTDVGCGLVYS